jgi:hypothetical protein
MRRIPPKLREEMASDPYYSKCCITGNRNEKIDFHHNLIFAGRQVNEKWCILPLSKSMHDIEKRPDIKERLDWIMLNRASDDKLRRYSKAIDLIRKRDILNKKHGTYSL